MAYVQPSESTRQNIGPLQDFQDNNISGKYVVSGTFALNSFPRFTGNLRLGTSGYTGTAGASGAFTPVGFISVQVSGHGNIGVPFFTL